jgi:hypothetical protein
MIDKLLKPRLHMPNETNALAAARRTQATPNEGDYQAFCSALTSSARGRDFLSEYARRNRNSDTQVLLDALSRLEAHIHADRSAAEQMRDQLRMLLIAIRLARPEIAGAAPDRMSKLRSLLDMLERRLDVMAQSDANAPPLAAATPEAQPEIELIRARLAVVPRPDEPELPIPSPAAQPPAIALVGAAAIMSSPFDGAASPPEKSQMANTAADKTAPAPAAAAAAGPAARAAPLPPAADPLIALMALSEDERLALFT